MALGVLVGHFEQLVRMRNAAAEPGPPASQEENFPPEFQDLRERVAHHLIPLALIARADGDFADAERKVILEHCASFAGLNPGERAMLEDYLRQSRPALSQLDPALKRLEQENPGNAKAFVDTAEQVIRADGRTDPAELRLLEHIRRELAH